MNSGTLDHKCPNCAAALKFNPHGQNWKCDYCNSEFSKEEIAEVEAKRGVENLTKDTEAVKLEKNLEGMDIYSCPNCGAEILADEHTSATFCVYCKSTAILKNKLVGEFNPSKLIPFFKTRDDAVKAFKGLKKGRPFMPKEFSNIKNIEETRGIYIPFWLYDYSVNGYISATGKKVRSWSSGGYRYTKTDTYAVERGGSMNFYKIPVDGSTHFDNSVMNSIEPFDYSKLENFSHSYLSGFLAEKYDVDSNAASLDADNRAKNTTTEVLRNDIHGYSSVIVNSSNHNISKNNCDYVLLPVWLLNIKYKDKLHTFAMNGQTGKMIGDIPIDKKKAVIWSVCIFLISIILCTIVWFILG